MLSPPPAVKQSPMRKTLQQAEVQVASLPPQDDLPDNIALPGWRPRAAIDQQAERAASQQAQGQPSHRPTGRP